MNKTRIVIAGIGGVGGYFGGLLAKYFYGSDKVEIIFIARGEHLKEIQKRGLKVIKGDREFMAKPSLATDKPSEIGIADFVIICTKSYDLELAVQQLHPCINQDTILLPLLNGVDSRERIRKFLPENIILEGCVYIVSRLKQAGVIENSGNIEKLYFGLDGFENEKLRLLESLFNEAGIDSKLSQSISALMWEKFIFISPTATATSYFDSTIGMLLEDPEKLKVLIALIEEVKELATAKQILVSEDIAEKTLNKLKALPYQTTSSMHDDFKLCKPRNEWLTLTGYVVLESQKLNLEAPCFNKIYADFETNEYIEKHQKK